jgi:hypothetical protein
MALLASLPILLQPLALAAATNLADSAKHVHLAAASASAQHCLLLCLMAFIVASHSSSFVSLRVPAGTAHLDSMLALQFLRVP